MRYPPRLAHLATRAIVVAKLAPTYAAAHSIEDEEGSIRLYAALKGRLLEDLLAATWELFRAANEKADDDKLLEKIARSLKNRPMRPGKLAELNQAWSAFMVLADVEAGTASDVARNVLETNEGKLRAQKGLQEAAAHLAREFSRK